MTTLGDQLREEAVERERKTKLKQWQKEQRERKALAKRADEKWAELEPTLEGAIKAAAAKDGWSIDIPDILEYHEGLNAWAKKNGMHVHVSRYERDSEIPWTYSATICWADCKSRRTW